MLFLVWIFIPIICIKVASHLKASKTNVILLKQQSSADNKSNIVLNAEPVGKNKSLDSS